MRLLEIADVGYEMHFEKWLKRATNTELHSRPQLYVPREGGSPRGGVRYKTSIGKWKPKGFWTSSAEETASGWDSAWNQWVKSEMPDWFSGTGYILQPQASARILELNTDSDYLEIYDLYVAMTNANHLKTDDFMTKFNNFPWPWIQEHFDAVHAEHPSRSGMFTNPWDVESTVWFDMKHLSKPIKVKVSSSGLRT